MYKTLERDNYAYRVAFACRVIADKRETTRNFDNCFEMSDGDAVAVAVYRRSRKNPRIRANLFRYLSRCSVVPLAFKERRRSTSQLKAWAAEQRREANARYATA